MGELAEYLVRHDPNFARSRLPALYSDLRLRRSNFPDEYRAHISAWRLALSHLVSKGLISHPGATPNVLALTVDHSLLRALEMRPFGQPTALGTVIREAAAERELIPAAEFLKAQQSIYERSWSGVPWGVMSWTLRQLGVIDPSKGDDKLPVGQYVVVKNVEAAAKVLADLMAEKSTKFDRIFTKVQFQKTFSSALVKDQSLSDADLEVLLKFLSRDKGVIEYDGQTIRIKGAGDQAGISEEDSAIASLKELIESLKHQTGLLNTRIEELTKLAKDAVTRKNRVAALAALKSKKTTEASLTTRYATLNQLEDVAAKIEQASDNVQLVKVMEASSGVLKNLNAQVGGVEKVDSVMDRVREQMNATDEVGAILAESTGAVIDEGEIDDELEVMLAQEREKEQEEQRLKQEAERKVKEAREAKEAEEAQKKLDALPPVPQEAELLRQQAQTPTSATRIANLSMEEKPRAEREEPLLAT